MAELDGGNVDIFDDNVRRTIKRRLEAMNTDELLDTLGYLILRERAKSAEKS
jgi:hypothetical protein